MVTKIQLMREIMDMYNNQAIENGNINLTPPPGKELSQESFLAIALRHRWIILSTTLLFLIVGLLYLLKATPIYTSTARLYVEQTGPKIISEYEGVMTQSKNYLYTQSELIKSTPIIIGIADDAQMNQLRTFSEVDNLVAYLKKILNITVGKKDDIIAVSLNSPYPSEAAQIVNALVESYIEYHATRKRSTVLEVLKILQKEKVKRDKQLSEKFKQMLEFSKTSGVLSLDNNSEHIVFQRLAKLSEALTEAQLATINARADYEAALSMKSEPAKIKQFAMAQPNVGVRVSVNDMETQLLSELKALEAELKNVKLYCTEEHPSVQALRSKVNHIKGQLAEQAKQYADAYIEVMRLRWETAKQREDELLTSFASQREAAEDLSVKATEYSVLQSELKRTERLCEILDDRIKELNVTEDVGALNISILEVARPAIKPTKPQKARIMSIALALGLIFGCSLALLRDWLDYRLRSADEISAVLGLPVLGIIPTMSEGATIADHSQKVWLKFKPMLTKAYLTIYPVISHIISKGKIKVSDITSPIQIEGNTISERQTILERGQKVRLKPKSVIAEAYRTVRTAVFFGVPKGKAQTILVTSPAAGDGKSTLASNLAIAMAQAGQKTLILDADFRKPMQHKIFQIDNKMGLSSILAGRHNPAEATQVGPVERLDLMLSGPEVSNPSEMLNSDTFTEMLKDLSERYDRIIIDSPPVAPVADSKILGALCDITLLVLRAEKSTRRHSQHARDGLLSVGAHILGAVVNDVSRKAGRYGYYSGDGYYAGYGSYGYYGHRNKKEERDEKPALEPVGTKSGGSRLW
jgi:succinoglycan biosynthesis transport protein ExoP